jgi:hypothetical protein
MKNLLLIGSIIILVSSNLIAQEQNTDVPGVKDNLFKVNFLVPGVEYEIGLDKYNTINLSFDIGFQIAVYDNGFKTDTEIFIRPIIGGQFRHYYNFGARKSKGKVIKNNSANFVALDVTYMFKPFNQPSTETFEAGSVFGIGPVWGINRTYETGFSLSLYIGAGYVLQDFKTDLFDTSGIGFLGGFRLGFVTNRDK